MAWKFLCTTLFMVLWSLILFHQMSFHACSGMSECRSACLLSLASYASFDSSFFSDYLFKLLLIGDSGVGKSCLLLRFAVSSPVLDTSNRVLWHQSEALLLSMSAGRHLHWELHQHHRSGFQDPHHRARREDHQAADCKCACKHSFNQRNCSNWAALPRQCLTFGRDTWSSASNLKFNFKFQI